MRDHARFLAAFVRRPFDTGAIAPSSTHLARVIVDEMGIEDADTVVELGPGTGVFTKVIQDQLKPGARFLSFEINPDLARTLSARFPGVQVVNDSVENLAHHLKAAGRHEVDTTISGLPWAAFSPHLRILTCGLVADGAQVPRAAEVTFPARGNLEGGVAEHAARLRLPLPEVSYLRK